MAGKQNPQKKVIHRQTFQNSNQMVELTVKTIPKNLHNEASKIHPPFVRDCALRKEIQKVVDDKNNNISNKGIRKINSERYANDKGRTKVSKGRVTVEIVKNKSNRDQHEILSHNATWEEMLHSCSTILSSSNSDKSEDSSVFEIPTKFRNSENSKRSLIKDKDEYLERQATKAQVYGLKQNQSVQTSFVNAPHRSTINFQQRDVRNTQEEPFHLENNQSRKTRSVAIEVNSDDIRSSIQRGQLQGSGMQRAPSMQTRQEQISNRLLSDDVNNSPFGESALHLLHQLRERLQTRGDNEGSNMVGVLEAFIGMRGSTGSVGSGNPGFQTCNASPLYTTVFQTPVDQPNYKTNQERNIRHQPVQQDDDKMSARVQRQGVRPASEHQNIQLNAKNPRVPVNSAQNKRNEQESNKENEENEKTFDKLKRVIEHQRKVILEQENNIEELRTLSTRILSQKEEFLQAAHSNQELVEMQPHSNKDSAGKPDTRNQDSGYGLEDTERSAHPMQVTHIASREESDNVKIKQRNADKELRSSLLHLQTENQILRKEVQDNRDLILNLENQLTRAYREIESERQSRCGLSLSRLSGSVPNLDSMSNRVEPEPTKREHNKPPSSILGESEADSAYEEKSGSHLTSKLNSPHMDGLQGKDSGSGLAMAFPLQPQEASEKPKECDIPVDTVLLQTGHIGKEATVPAALMNAATVPSSEILSHVTSRAGNLNTVPNKDNSHQQVVYPKRQLRNSQKASQANKGFHSLGLKVSDLEPVPVVVLEDPTFTSFSTVSELSHQESVACEKSFLQGITVSRQSSKPSSRVTSPVNLEHVDHSLTNLHPLESTRVKESSHTLSESQEFVALKGNETSTSSEFNSVEELE